MTFRGVAGFNVAYILVVGWLRYFAPPPLTPTGLSRLVMDVALDAVLISFSWWLYRLHRLRQSKRVSDRLMAGLAAHSKLILMVMTGLPRRRPRGDPFLDYFGRLVAAESDRRHVTMIGFFDEGGHFVMRPADEEGLAALEAEHPPPELTDDLDNSWEPES